MNKIFQYVMLTCMALGYLIYSMSRIFRDYLTDFWLGFCEGLSMVFIISGFIYVCWCLAKKKNPYKIENGNK